MTDASLSNLDESRTVTFGRADALTSHENVAVRLQVRLVCGLALVLVTLTAGLPLVAALIEVTDARASKDANGVWAACAAPIRPKRNRLISS